MTLQNEMRSRQVHRVIEVESEIRLSVTVCVAVYERVAFQFFKAQFTRSSVEVFVTDEGESLIAAHRGVGIDTT